MTLATSAFPGQFISATATSLHGRHVGVLLRRPVQGQINLVLSGSATPNPVLAGGALTYTFTVSNEGYKNADGVSLTDQFPGSLTLGSVSTSQGFRVPVSSPGLVDVYLGTIAIGASATVTIVTQTGGGSVGTIIDSATVTSQESDPTPSLESASVTTTVLADADLSVAIAEGPNPALMGTNLTYTMTLANQGPDPAANVVATLPVASGLSFVSATASVGTASYEDGQVVVTLGSLAVNSADTVTLVLQAQAPGEVQETASVTSQADDPNPSNNAASVTTEIDPATDLSVHVAASTPVAATGVPFDYVVTVTNNGPMAATSVALSDSLPTGVTFVSATTDQGVVPSQAGGIVTATLSTLAVGASANLTIVVNPTASPGAILTDSASVTGEPVRIRPITRRAWIHRSGG